MTVWSETALIGLYTLTPTHCGTGQTTGAVDLPIARDASTGFPILPATGIKGVLRDYAETGWHGTGDEERRKIINCLFGKDLDQSGSKAAGSGGTDDARAQAGVETLEVGRLAFTEARLVAYPSRSLNRPFLHVTCPLILERLARDLRAVGRGDFLEGWQVPQADKAVVLVSAEDLIGPLVLEDLAYEAREVEYSSQLRELSTKLAELLPGGEADTRKRLEQGLVLIPDGDFGCLMESGVPVQARIKLTAGKTTDTWYNSETGKPESGNLWYEEHLPPDALFLALVGERRQRVNPHGKEARKCDGYGLASLLSGLRDLSVVQIGGNETVGQGLCHCTLNGRPGVAS